MKYISSKNIGHADGLSRLIRKCAEPLEDTVIAALREEKELSGLLCNMIRELPVTLDDINKAAENRWIHCKNEKTGAVKWKVKERLKNFAIFYLFADFNVCRESHHNDHTTEEDSKRIP